jgi:hypothetical protein
MESSLTPIPPARRRPARIRWGGTIEADDPLTRGGLPSRMALRRRLNASTLLVPLTPRSTGAEASGPAEAIFGHSR